MESNVVLEAFVSRINAHDVPGILGLCTDDHIFTDSLGCRLVGIERLGQAWTAYFALFPDYAIELAGIASNRDLVLACGFASATHGASGRSWRVKAAWRALVRERRLSEWQVHVDNKPVYELLAESD